MTRGFLLSPANTAPFSAVDPPLSGGRSFNAPQESRLSSRNNNIMGGDCVFGSVPSRIEVERAILDLLRFMRGLSSTSEQGGSREFCHLDNSTLMQSPGFQRFCDAFSMMQNEPAVRSTVTSLSCDEAVWRAILNNNMVRDLQGSITTALIHENKDKRKRLSNSEEPDITYLIMRWIMEFAKSKILELVERFRLLVNEVLRHDNPVEKPNSEVNDVVEEKVKSSVLLAVIIIIIVVVTRSQGLS